MRMQGCVHADNLGDGEGVSDALRHSTDSYQPSCAAGGSPAGPTFPAQMFRLILAAKRRARRTVSPSGW